MIRHKQLSLLALAAALVAAPLSAHAGIFDFLKRKKKAKTEQTTPPQKSAYERIVGAEKIESARGSFLTLHKTDNQLYLEIPTKTIGEEILIGVTLSSISNPQLGMVGFKNSNPVHMRFAQRDSAIVLEAVNSEPHLISPHQGKAERARLQQSYTDLALYKFPIRAWNKDKTTVVVDVTSLFTTDQKYFRLMARSVGRYSVNARPLGELTHIREVKSFDDNVSIKVDRSYRLTLSAQGGGSPLKDYPVTLGATFTILRLPKEPMTPRLSDTRIGVFQTSKSGYNPETRQYETIRFAHRFRLVPSDLAAYKRGEAVRPVKPIVFYVDNAFPPIWKEAMKEGTLRWNAAFERIGFKDALEVRDFPTDDPSFDPDNLKYNCIRYIPIATENAMGPSWTDPRSGEIINASVLVWSDVSKLNNNWRFIQTAQVDPAVRAVKLPDSLMAKSLKYVIAHEIGHTLGFMHNMGASAAYSVDSLRSATFTAVHGTTPSIMDYARFNYVAQPGDKGLTLDPPTVGTYDKYMIDWTYRYFPDSKGDILAEQAELRKLIDQHAHDPEYRYGLQQVGEERYDPSSIEEDLSNDPVAASTLGLKNLKYIASHLGEWFPQPEQAEHRSQLYRGIADQALRYVNNVFINVPGIYLYQTDEASGLPRYKVVPRDKQRASALWLLDQALSIDSLRNEALEQTMTDVVGDSPFVRLGAMARAMAIRNINSLNLSYYLDSTSYAPQDYADEVFARVFAPTQAGREQLTPAELQLQEYYVRYISAYTSELASKSAPPRVSVPAGLAALTGYEAASPERKEGMTDEEFIALLPQQSEGSHQCSFDRQHGMEEHAEGLGSRGFLNFGASYGEPADLFTAAINNTDVLYLPLQYRLEALLRKVIPTTKNSELRLHYELLLRKLEAISKPK